jgi:predicted Zn-dependent protease
MSFRWLKAATLAVQCAGLLTLPVVAADDAIQKMVIAKDNVGGMAACDQVLRKNPRDARATMYHALFRFWNGDRRGGLNEMRDTVNRFPDYPPSHTHLANMLLGIGDAGGAFSQANKSIALTDTDAGPHTVLAQVYLYRRQFPLALREAEISLSSADPISPEMCETVKLCALAGENRLHLANKFISKIDASKLRYDVMDGFSNYLLKSGNFPAALVLASLSEKYTKTAMSSYLLMYAECNSNHFAQAESAAKRLWQRNPHDTDGRIVMGTYYVHEGMYAEAADCLKKITSPEALRHKETWELAYKVHKGQQKYEEAIKDLDHIIALSNPVDKVAIIAQRGDTYLLSGDTPKALAEYSSAIKADPTNAQWYRKRAEAYQELNNCKAADADMRKASSLR